MRLYFLSILFLLFALQSCFVVDNLLEEDEKTLSLPFEVVVKDSVYQYIQTHKNNSQKYLSYGYDPMQIIVPKPLLMLEKWEGRVGDVMYNKTFVEENIKHYDSIVKTQGLKRKISINHVFSIREESSDITELQEVNFILSNELKIIDYLPKYHVNLSTEQEKLFAKFYYETPILKAYSYEESQKLSKKFYGYFKQEWHIKENSLEKEQFLYHILDIVKTVDSLNSFDVQAVAQNALIKYMTDKRSDIKKYQPVDFSALYEINQDEKLEGYYFFHTFSFENNDVDVNRMSVYVRFNPFYEVERVVETNQSYDAIK